MNAVAPYWQAVALAGEIGVKPRRVLFNGLPVVLFRSARGIAALSDRCPHRLVELSKGRIVDGDVECPYHGWRFNGTGRCTAIPGLVGDVPQYAVKAYRVIEREDAVFIADGSPADEPYVHCMQGKDMIVRRVSSSTHSSLVDAAENILDATHTHFTHAGLLRGLTAKRQIVDVEVTAGEGWVEACYTGEDRQQGLVSKLLEGQRARTIGRYRHPGIAELEYWGPDGLNLATTFHLRQADADTVEGIAFLMGPRQRGFGLIKALAFKPMFNIALQQDRRVLKSASRNAAHWPDARAAIGPLDFLRRDIEAIVSGDMPPSAAATRRFQIEL